MVQSRREDMVREKSVLKGDDVSFIYFSSESNECIFTYTSRAV
jgi:hypothetical protein